MIVVTGGAGFIGSALVHGLNKKGMKQIWVVDQIDHPEKQENLKPLLFDKLISKDEFLNNILENNLPRCDAILHMGACSSTTESNEAFLNKNNFKYTQHLGRFCLERDIRFIYASSAVTFASRASILFFNAVFSVSKASFLADSSCTAFTKTGTTY